MPKGLVRNTIAKRFFGWITHRDESNVLTDFFFHRDDYEDGTLESWQRLECDVLTPRNQVPVEFDIIESVRGPRACNVRRINMETT